MKRVAYVSTLKLQPTSSQFPSEMMRILNESRSNNRQLNVTGVLLLVGETVLQYLEGDDETIATLLYKINLDTRHHNLSVIMNTTADQRLFASWAMRVLSRPALRYEEAAEQIMRHCQSDFKITSESDKHRISSILGTPATEMAIDSNYLAHNKLIPTTQSNKYELGSISLKLWPRPNQIKMTNDMIILCSALSTKPHSLSELNTITPHHDEATLLKDMNFLDDLGLLIYHNTQKLKNTPSTAPSNIAPSNHDRLKNRFSKVLRRFLGANIPRETH